MNIAFNPAARIIDAPGQALAFRWPVGDLDTAYAKLMPCSRVYWDGKDFIVRTPPTVPSVIVNPVQEMIVAELARKRPVKLSLMYDGYPEDQAYLVVFAPANKLGRRFLARLQGTFCKAVVDHIEGQQSAIGEA